MQSSVALITQIARFKVGTSWKLDHSPNRIFSLEWSFLSGHSSVSVVDAVHKGYVGDGELVKAPSSF